MSAVIAAAAGAGAVGMHGVRQRMGFRVPPRYFRERSLPRRQPQTTFACRVGAGCEDATYATCAGLITSGAARADCVLRNLAGLRAACWLAALLAVLLADLIASPAAAQTGIRFTLDGPIEGPEALFLLPQDKGYFKGAGLAVVVDEAVSPLESISRVASGGHELGFVDLNALIRYRDQHPSTPVKGIFMVYNKPPYAVVARRSRGITEPKQIEHKKIGAPAAGSTFAQWPLFAKLNNIDVSKVIIENISVPVRAPMLAAGQIDAALGASFRLFVDLKERGVPPDDIVLMRMADYGMKLYGSAIVVNSKFAAAKPEAVAAFLHAFTRSLKETIRHPAEAAETVLKRDDAAKKEVELERLRMAISENILTPEVRANGLGAVELVRLEQSLEQIALVYTFKARPKPEDIFDASFLPPPAERKVN
jgi:NitT/TauT family transport system substrate-binding protein